MNKQIKNLSQSSAWHWLTEGDRYYHWGMKAIHVGMVLIALLAATDIALLHGWGLMQGVSASLAIFAGLWLMIRLCRWLAKFITLGYFQMHRLSQAMDRKLDELDGNRRRPDRAKSAPPAEPPVEQMSADQSAAGTAIATSPSAADQVAAEQVAARLNEANRAKNAEANLSSFIATVGMEREAARQKRVKDDAERLEQVLRYARLTLLPFGFTDEELAQVDHCVTFWVTNGSVVPSPAVNILRKRELTQADLRRFGWNIANQYGLPSRLTAQFVKSTFAAWFSNTELPTIQKSLRTAGPNDRIPIDPDILAHLPQLAAATLGEECVAV